MHSGPTSAPRATSLERLERGELDIVCAVDMFNEGVDVPTVDTVMMLRPTESRLLWLQQFGRGLRQTPGKDHLRVIDYIGNHRSFLIKPQALFGLGPGDAEVGYALAQVREGSADLPPGCEVTYDLQAIEVLQSLLRTGRGNDALRTYYEEFRARFGVRPRAVEAFHDGYSPRSVRKEFGSWLRFVGRMGDLDARQQSVLRTAEAFLDDLETAAMTKSYKMLVVLALLDADALPGKLAIDQLVERVATLVARSPRLQADMGTPAADQKALRRLLERYPIPAWTGADTPNRIGFFRYQQGVLSSQVTVAPADREAFQELTRELAEWRLAEYMGRSGEPTGASTRIVCRVSHSSNRPILRLPDGSERQVLPEGWAQITADSEVFEANFVKVAVNVLRKPGSSTNELPALMQRWFGPKAGLPRTGFAVAFERTDHGWQLVPVGASAARIN